ncbi:hypothetical protein TrCOL_g797 [Triparma columacea]|uniref:rRNA-processing protein FYV7 n=1 Tax=Triparma columacea TaxID=722753 RepID=A0A9W7GAK0_9STRA|nr:hypothetical protein TrCOL_g797 [Triparma columacea]
MSSPPPRRSLPTSSISSSPKSPNSNDTRILAQFSRQKRNAYDFRGKRDAKQVRKAGRIRGFKKALKQEGYGVGETGRGGRERGGGEGGGGGKGKGGKKSDMFEKSMSKAEATAKAREEEVRVKGEREEEERRKERDRKRRRMQHKRKTGKGQVKMDGVIKDLLGKIRKGKMEEEEGK